jgi:5-hydroxyisourate hydrolase-like protein (transthyretin family)
MKKRGRDTLEILVAATLFIMAAVAIYWGWLDTAPPSVNLNTKAIGHSTPGGIQQVQITVFKRRNCRVAKVDRNYTDSEGRIHHTKLAGTPSGGWSLAIGGPYRIKYAFEVDEVTALGRAVFRTTLYYRCNPIGVIPVSIPEVHFEVKAK